MRWCVGLFMAIFVLSTSMWIFKMAAGWGDNAGQKMLECRRLSPLRELLGETSHFWILQRVWIWLTFSQPCLLLTSTYKPSCSFPMLRRILGRNQQLSTLKLTSSQSSPDPLKLWNYQQHRMGHGPEQYTALCRKARTHPQGTLKGRTTPSSQIGVLVHTCNASTQGRPRKEDHGLKPWATQNETESTS